MKRLHFEIVQLVLFVALMVVSCCDCLQTQDDDDDDVGEFEDALLKDAVDVIGECGVKELTVCFKEKALNYIERLPNELDLGAGFKVRPLVDQAKFPRKYSSIVLPADNMAREQTLDRLIFDKISEYFNSHTVELRLGLEEMGETKSVIQQEEGRKKKDKDKGGIPYLLLFYLKAATLGAMALKAIGLIAFKALLIAKVAFTIASIIALKKLVEHKHTTSTYEVVAHPHYEDYGHFDKSFRL